MNKRIRIRIKQKKYEKKFIEFHLILIKYSNKRNLLDFVHKMFIFILCNYYWITLFLCLDFWISCRYLFWYLRLLYLFFY